MSISKPNAPPIFRSILAFSMFLYIHMKRARKNWKNAPKIEEEEDDDENENENKYWFLSKNWKLTTQLSEK